jgi:negative regulator of sigma E activity
MRRAVTSGLALAATVTLAASLGTAQVTRPPSNEDGPRQPVFSGCGRGE